MELLGWTANKILHGGCTLCDICLHPTEYSSTAGACAQYQFLSQTATASTYQDFSPVHYSAMMPCTLQTAADFTIDLEKKVLCLELASILQTLTLSAGCQQVALSARCQLQAGEVNSPVAAATGRRTNLLHSVPRWAGHLISDPGCGWGLACLVQ